MPAVILPFSRSSLLAPTPIPYEQMTAEGNNLFNWCLMLLEQMDVVRSGHEIDIPRKYEPAAIVIAQKELRQRGYPTKLDKDAGKGFGLLRFD